MIHSFLVHYGNLYFKENHHVKDKIRQQLQMLRDNGIIEFTGRGHYRKIQY